jgi:hypothetical protein
MAEVTPINTLYVLPHGDLDALAAAVQSELAKIPLQDLFGSVPRVVVEQFLAVAFHAHRGGPAAREDARPAAVTPLRAPAPPVAADTAATGAGLLPGSDVEEDDDDALPPGKRYHVKKGGGDRYPDIALAEIEEEEFDANEAWETRIKHLVHTKSDRAVESFRRSLLLDPRFERIGDSGYRFRRKVPRPQQGSAYADLGLGSVDLD